MSQTAQILRTSLRQAFQELRANRLRTFLSLTGITIGIFSIIAVFTVVDSLSNNIQQSVSTLGSDVLYIDRKPWTREDGEFKWWEYLQRKPMSLTELNGIEHNVPGIRYASICYVKRNLDVKTADAEVGEISAYAVTNYFDKIQNVEVSNGRYLSTSELEGSSNSVLIGHDVYDALFGTRDAVGKEIKIYGRTFRVVGMLKKSGQNMAGFNFDEAVVMSYQTASSMFDVHSTNWGNDPLILVKAAPGVNIDELRDEVTGYLRTERRVRPGGKNNFSINQLSQISETIGKLFDSIGVIAGMIGGFALVVGTFGIANIMFVTVKERTKIIGLKKAIGAKRSVILAEFLVEAIVLCIIGGLIGIILVMLLGLVLTHAFGFPVTLSLSNFIWGVSISAFVGTISGFIPAFRASRLNPVVAIRST